jgi:ParB-like chromosome segregation protein Spo0J
MLPIHDLIVKDRTRIARDDEHINTIAVDFERRLKEHPGEHPVQTPLRVVRRGDKWLIIAGGYRYLAGLRCGLTTMPCLVLSHELDDLTEFLEQAKDNQLHKPYTPMEQARNVLEVKRLRPELSFAEAGRLLGIGAAQSTKLLSVLKGYPEDLQALIGEEEGHVPFTTAYQLSRLKDMPTIRDLTEKVVKGQLNRDAATETVAKLLGGKKQKRGAKPAKGRTQGGVAFTLPEDLERAHADVLLLGKAIKKAIDLNLPGSAVQSLLRGV